jgi:hypothetical protein
VVYLDLLLYTILRSQIKCFCDPSSLCMCHVVITIHIKLESVGLEWPAVGILLTVHCVKIGHWVKSCKGDTHVHALCHKPLPVRISVLLFILSMYSTGAFLWYHKILMFLCYDFVFFSFKKRVS